MPNKKKLIIFGIIIIILLIVSIILIVNSNINETRNGSINNGETGKLYKLYQKIKDNQRFTFSMEEKNDDLVYKISMIQRGTDVSIDIHSEEEHTTTLVLENKAYFIMHDEQEYYDFGDEEVDADIIMSGLEKMTEKDYSSGKEKINGKSYYYEEYDNDGDNFTIFAEINEESKIKTRFYFDKDNLVYIKNIVTNEDHSENEHTDDDMQEELIKASLVYDIDEKLFELPKDYAETKYN